MAEVIDQPYNELVTKARLLFWTKGYQDVNVNDLADCLEMSPSKIYKKYSKDMLFVDALDSYVDSLANPILTQLRKSEQGMETFKDFFFGLIDALLNKTFPRSCLMVNTVVELHHAQDRLNLTEVYGRYFGNLRETYIVILNRAAELKELKEPEKVEKYADFLMGVIFGLSILYKVKTKEELQEHVLRQLALLV